MDVNLSKRARGNLYVFVIIGGPIVGYLIERGWLGSAEFVLWTGITTAVATMARFNLTPERPTQRPPDRYPS